jgi:predicted dehydrogenase
MIKQEGLFMKESLNIGIIGLDTSHVTAFTRLLNDSNTEYHVPGGKIISAFPGGSADFELSISRVEGFTNELHNNFSVSIVDSPEAVAERCDALLIESVDGRVHLEQFARVAVFGKPVFIDKPLALNSRDAEKIIELSMQYNIPLMSCSACRFAEGLTQTLSDKMNGYIIGAECFGPMHLQPTQPGLFWYGIHTVDMLYAIMGKGCVEVISTTTTEHDVIAGIWKDGRIGTIRGNRKGNNKFGAVIHREQSSEFVDISSHPKPYYASMLEGTMKMFKTHQSPIDIQETREVIRFIEAANESLSTGERIKL